MLKQWKKVYTRFRNLRDLCPAEHRGLEGSVSTSWTSQCWEGAKMTSY